MPDSTVILPILITMIFVICIGGASLLFLRSRKDRPRRILSIIMMIWGILYVTRLYGFIMNIPSLYFTNIDIMSLALLTGGNFFLIILLLYPLEVIRPGWLNMKRISLLFLPYMFITLFYYIVLLVLGEKPVALNSMEQFIMHLGEFNVWFRIVMALSIIIYLVFLFYLAWTHKVLYRQWCDNNYSNDENLNISWLRQYGLGVVLIGVAYFIVLFKGSTLTFVMHNITVQCFFCYTLYKGLFHENPYTNDFFSDTMDEAEASRTAELKEEQLLEGITTFIDTDTGESAFLNKLPLYRDEISRWMANKKPYLNPDFKLMDVTEVLPLNRTYLSRVFNEGFGNTFYEVVRNYRIQEAERMLLSRKDIPVGQVGELCGFSSPSVFNRVFVQSHEGLTPNGYRKRGKGDNVAD